MKRNVVWGVAGVLALSSVLTACGGGADGTQSGESSNEMYHATLAYLVSNDSAADIDMVEEKFNELTQEQLNMTVDLMPLSLGTFKNQVQLYLASGDPIDIVPLSADVASAYVTSDYLTDITQLLESHGQDIVSTVGEDLIPACSVDGFTWGVPVMKERYSPLCLVCRTDILEDCGIDPASVTEMSDLTEVFAAVYEKYPNMTIFGGTQTLSSNDYDYLSDRFGVLMDKGQSTQVTNLYETDLFKQEAELAHQWYEAGYIMKDMATNQDSGETLMRAGNLFSYATYFKPNTEQEKEDSTGYDLTVIRLDEGVRTSSGINGMAYGIGSSAQDPEKAMELLNWIYKTEEANDLLNWGVEGVHWIEAEDGTATYPEGVTAENCGYHQNYGWAQPNQFNAHPWYGNDSDVWAQYEEFNLSGTPSVALGFMTDLTSCSNELAALQQVSDQYLKQITCGVADPETAIDEFNSALYDAGLQKVMDTKQEQLDQWLAEK